MYGKLSYLMVAIAMTISLAWAVDGPNPRLKLDHAKVARRLVHQATWAAVATISTNEVIKDYPMVNVISVNDKNAGGRSTGLIQFLLTDLDYTGPDWQRINKATFLFTDEQMHHCSKRKPNPINPMEPICSRVIISGQIKKLDTNTTKYEQSLKAFITWHPAAKRWLQVHTFYLCELEIKNIILMHGHGGPKTVNAADYYNVQHP